LSLITFDRLQDSFAEDGTMNPASTGRVDTNTIKDGSNPIPGTHLRDTLVARVGSSTNTEVRMYFAVRPGPFTNLTNLGNRAARWTPASGIAPTPGAFGNTWYYARLDTAEQGGTVSPGNYMATFHESDPGFQGTDRAADPADPNQLENEILPDHILTPGSRIDYFLASRFIPPDPRNVGGTNWYIERDTAGAGYREMEILPSSMQADTSWNCVLYVDHHDDRSFGEQQTEEAALTAALGGGGGANAEGTLYDRFDNQTPSSGQLSFGRAIQTNYGCTSIQIFAYKAIAWFSATLASVQLTDEDANVVRPWLTLPEVGNNSFWGSGDGLVRSMSTSNEVSTVSFMQNILAVLATCNTVREATCPGGTVLDSTYCLPLAPVGGAHFATAGPLSVRGNGCNDLRSFDVNGWNTAVTTGRGQLDYLKNGNLVHYASVTNHNTVDVDYRTVTDGFALGAVRTPTGDPHSPSACTDMTAAFERAADVLAWFGTATSCGIPMPVAAGEDPNLIIPPPQARLGLAAPNPMSSATLIRFEITTGRAAAGPAVEMPVRIEIVDVSGRRARTLVDAPFGDGPHAVTWDGRNDAGRPVSQGLYFYRLTAPGTIEAKKILVVR